MSGSMMMLLRRGTVPAGRHVRTLRQYASAAAAGDSTPQPEPEELEIDPALDLPTDPMMSYCSMHKYWLLFLILVSSSISMM